MKKKGKKKKKREKEKGKEKRNHTSAKPAVSVAAAEVARAAGASAAAADLMARNTKRQSAKLLQADRTMVDQVLLQLRGMKLARIKKEGANPKAPQVDVKPLQTNERPTYEQVKAEKKQLRAIEKERAKRIMAKKRSSQASMKLQKSAQVRKVDPGSTRVRVQLSTLLNSDKKPVVVARKDNLLEVFKFAKKKFQTKNVKK